MEHPQTSANRRWRSALTLILVVVILCLLFQPVATSDVGLDRRRALLKETVRQRDEVPTPAPAPVPASSAEPAQAVPVVAVVIPAPAIAEPKPPTLPAQKPDAYLDSVHRYLRNLELRHYDELARRKESFDQQMKSETIHLARQMEQLADFKAPPATVELSPYLQRRITYCLSCHERRSNVEIANFFDRAGSFYH